MSVSIVTQTCVRPECADAFVRWQSETSALAAGFPGFIEQNLLPPKPPLQVDWVILQRFRDADAARNWLASPQRQQRLEGAADMLVGRDDVHIVPDVDTEAPTQPVSAVISTRVRPGKEADYQAWLGRITAAQARTPGLQGYRLEPAIPGVQEDYVAILRFDSVANLQLWLDSPERKKLLEEALPLTVETHARIVHSGFEQWFKQETPGAAPLPVWKMDMLVLLMLYPIVFLFGVFVGTPLLAGVLKLPFAVSLFLGNVVSVGLTGFLVPWVARHFGWWLRPAAAGALKTHLLGAGLILALYAVMVVAFWHLF